jgi:hypothetical protein
MYPAVYRCRKSTLPLLPRGNVKKTPAADTKNIRKATVMIIGRNFAPSAESDESGNLESLDLRSKWLLLAKINVIR